VGDPVVLGSSQALVVAAPELVAEAAWGSFAKPRGVDRWTVDFVTPMSIQAGKRYSPFPAPFSIIPSLVVRWNALAPPEFVLERFESAELATVWVSDIVGRTVIQHVAHQKPTPNRPLVVPGFVGSLTLRCPEPDIAARVDGLLRMAEFTGIGANTSHGLGTVRLKREQGRRAAHRPPDRFG
jgi:CRISPR-associated endoribonuclease Cas6